MPLPRDELGCGSKAIPYYFLLTQRWHDPSFPARHDFKKLLEHLVRVRISGGQHLQLGNSCCQSDAAAEQEEKMGK